MGGPSSASYDPAYVETCRIFNVNINDWSVDIVTENGGKRWFDVQLSSPYFHFMNGEGQYTMPEVGALAWLCIPSDGKLSNAFLMGFQAPYDAASESYRAGRQSLNPGDMMMRTRDENFIILRRGGVVQVGATPIAQRIYVPIGNFINDFCENYKLSAFGGELFWETLRNDQSPDGAAPTIFALKAKQFAQDPEHIAELTIGSHGTGDTTTIGLTVWSDGSEEREARMQFQISSEGDVSWNVEKDWTQNITGRYVVRASGEVVLETEDAFSMTASKNASIGASKDLSLKGGKNVALEGGTQLVLDAPRIKHGGAALSQAVKGTELVNALNAFCVAGAAASEGPLSPFKAVYAALQTVLGTTLSGKNFVE
jgi:hypothetical protein